MNKMSLKAYASARFRVRRALDRYEAARHRAVGAAVGSGVQLPAGSVLTPRTTIDDHVSIRAPIFIDGTEPVTIGRWSALGGGIRIISSNHRMTYPSLHMGAAPELQTLLADGDRGPVAVGAATWIGDSVVLLPGVSVGIGAVIGAGSVVATDVPPFSIAVGNPARVLRSRFSEEVAAALLDIAWWSWTSTEIERRRAFFMADLTCCSIEEIWRLATA